MQILSKITDELMQGRTLSTCEAGELPAVDLHELMYHANRLRRHFKGDRVNLCSIINAKSGRCSEDCKFCAQSGHYNTACAEYPLVENEKFKAALSNALRHGARCFGVVTSGRQLSPEESGRLCGFIKDAGQTQAAIGASLGEIDVETMRALKLSGLKKFHHNLETAESFFPNICTTHSFAGRVETIRRAKEAGFEVCSGGILGLGETWRQRIEFADTLRSLGVDSVPLNFLTPIAGTPLEHREKLTPAEILRCISLFRFMMPDKDISICGGREAALRDMQSWIFYAGANGMMTGGYLTTGGREPEKDLQMLQDLGLNNGK